MALQPVQLVSIAATPGEIANAVLALLALTEVVLQPASAMGIAAAIRPGSALENRRQPDETAADGTKWAQERRNFTPTV
jgi:hypothetical protein